MPWSHCTDLCCCVGKFLDTRSSPHPGEALSNMRRHASPGLILAQAARRSGDGGRGVPQAVQLLLRRARLPQTADASLAALPRPQSVSGGSGDLVCHSGDRRRGATFGSSRPADAGTLAGMVALDLHRDPVLAGGQGCFHAAGGRGQPRRDAGRHSAALRGRAHPRLQSCSGQEATKSACRRLFR